MKYIVSNKTTKQGQKGDYTQCTLTNEAGEVFDKINLFNGEAKDKTEIEGDLIQNGQYWNFKAKVTYTANIPSRNGAISQAQDKKAENIAQAQDVKQEGIALSGSITNATHLVVAMMEAGLLSVEELGDIKGTITHYMAWYQKLYKPESSKMTEKELDHVNNPPF